MKIFYLAFVFYFISSNIYAQSCDSAIIIHHTYDDDSYDFADYGYEIDSLLNGNIISRTDSFLTFERRYYDGQNRLSAIVDIRDSDSLAYSYDALSRRDITDYFHNNGSWIYDPDTARSRKFFRQNGSDSLYVKYHWNGSFQPFFKRIYYYTASDTLYKWEELTDGGSGFSINSTCLVHYVNGLRTDTAFAGAIFSSTYTVVLYDSLERVTEVDGYLGGYSDTYEYYYYQCNQLQLEEGSCVGCWNWHHLRFEYDSLCNMISHSWEVEGNSDNFIDMFRYYRIGCHTMFINSSIDSIICQNDSSTISSVFFGGTPPYTYSWSPLTGVADPYSLTTRVSPDTTTNYIITVTDSNNLTMTDTVRVTVYDAPYSTLHIQSIDTTSTCQWAILETDSLNGFQFRWYQNGINIPGNFRHQRIIQNGTYVVAISSNYCSIVFDTIVFQSFTHNAPDINLSTGCGIIIANTNVPCTITWYQNGIIINGVHGDTLQTNSAWYYSAIATDMYGCASTMAYINYYAPNFQLNKRDACINNCNGSISIYGYSNSLLVWSTGEHTSEIDSLCPDIYSVTAIDAYGCVHFLQDTIKEFPFVSMHPIVIPASSPTACDGIAAIVDSLNNMNAFDTYWLNSSSNIADSLCTGWYYVTVYPANGYCQQQDSVYVGVLSATDTCSLNITKHDIVCNGDHTGSVMAHSSTGNHFLSMWTDTNSNVIYASTISPCLAGTYTCVMIDSTGCSDTATVSINEPPPIIPVFSYYHNACEDSCAVSLSLSGGVPPYTYHWCNNSTQPVAYTCNAYCVVTITDQNTCVQQFVSSQSLNSLHVGYHTTAASCQSCNDGTITFTASGGNPPYLYSIDSIQSNNSLFQNLYSGNHYACIIDSAGCMKCDTIVVSFPNNTTAIDKTDFSIYPNPVTDYLKVQFTMNEKGSYQIKDILGREIIRNDFSGTQIEIRDLKLIAGVYILNINGSIDRRTTFVVK